MSTVRADQAAQENGGSCGQTGLWWSFGGRHLFDPTSVSENLPTDTFMCVCMRACMLSHARLFVTPWSVATRLLCPWNFPGKNTGVGCHFQLQGYLPHQAT